MQKIVEFFLEVKSELSKVVWPSKKQTMYYTGVVIVVSIVIAVILGAADYGLIQVVQKVVNR
jgi:preprotein translocase subunit SecE